MRRPARIAVLLVLEFCVILAIASLGDLRRHVPLFLILFAFATFSFLLAFRLARVQRVSLRVVVIVGVLLRVPMFLTQPSLSDDVWRYLHDGRAQLAGTNPYRYAPNDPATQLFRGPEHSRINHSELPTIYPPAAQLAFRFAAAFPNPLLAWRLLLLAAELALLFSAAALLKERGGNVANLALYAWHPLAIIESIGSAHLEPIGLALLVIACGLLLRGSQLRAGLALAGSVAAKLIAAPLAIVATRNYRLPAALAIGVLVLYAPFLMDGTNVLGSLGTFAERWESNSSLHALLAPWMGQRVYRICAALVMIAGLIALRIARVEPVDAALYYFLALFMLAPVVHPWYLLWLLAGLPLRRDPLDAIGGAALLWSATVVLAYAAHYQQQAYGEWTIPAVLLVLEYVPVYVLMLYSTRQIFIHHRDTEIAESFPAARMPSS